MMGNMHRMLARVPLGLAILDLATLTVAIFCCLGLQGAALAAASPGSGAAGQPIQSVRFETPWDFSYKDNVSSVRQTLQAVQIVLDKAPGAKLEIIGHTWNRGGEMLNHRLSARQAELLKELLVREFGVAAPRIVVRGMGADEPLPGRTPRDAANRRLELVVHDRQPLQAARPAGPLTPAPATATAHAMPRSLPPALLHAPPASLTLYFALGRNTIHPDSVEALKQTASLLQAWPQARATLVGHADNRGDPARNLTLSRQRAETVRQALHAAFGIALERMCVEGAGDATPVADNNTSEGRARNRRVEVLLEGIGHVAPVACAVPQTQATAAAPAAPAAPKMFVVDGEVVAAGPTADRYSIEISVRQCTLWLYERLPDGGRRLVKEYTVATAKNGMDHPEGLGYVTKIDKNPWWYPTPDMKRRAAAKGQSLGPVPPGRKGNPMGAVKIHLSHGPTYRIHGTNRPDQIGRRVSLGCIRMRNQEALELANLIDVGAEVNVLF